MTLSLLILVAVAVPTVVLVLLYAFSSSIPWLGARPRALAGLELLIGITYVAATLYDARSGFSSEHVWSIMPGIAFTAAGLHRWLRGQPAAFD